MGLANEIEKQIKTLSGGNKRKVSIAQSLIGKSKLIFLDEPTSSLDPVSRQNLIDTLENLKFEDRTIIFTTHYLEEAEILADKIAIFKSG